ncbi:MAG: hypothetical protein ACTSSH_02385 [Candidatus Heimdallarchaeota archaeon]
MTIKPESLCLVQMGKAGLELVKSYPEVLSEDELNNIVLKSMPLGAKDGDFTTNTVGNNVLSSYIFSMPGEERTNVASLVAVFNDMDHQPQIIKKVFSFTVTELKKNNYNNMDIFSELLPKLYAGLTSGHLKLKLSSVLTIDMEIDTGKEDPKDKDSFDDLSDDIW